MKKVEQQPKYVKQLEGRNITVTDAAKRLGVTRTHLSLVIHGHRQSRSLTQRYAALKQAA